MGASLLLTFLQLPDQGNPDYAAGHAAIERLTSDGIDLDWNLGQSVEWELADTKRPEGAPDDWPTEEDLLAVVKRRLHQRVDELRAAYGAADTRAAEQPSHDYVVLELFGHRLLVTGGSSWGDSPTDLYDVIGDLSDCPAVLRAMRCDLDIAHLADQPQPPNPSGSAA